MTLYGEERPPPADDRPTVQVTAVSWPIEEPVRPAPVPPDGDRSRSRRFRLLLASGVATAVLGSVGAVAVWAYAGDVPRGTSVLGTELGGRSRTDAARELQAQLDRRAAELQAPIQVRVGERTAEINPAEVGLTVDVEATVAAAAATSAHAVDRLVGSREVEPVVSVDVPKLETALKELVGDQGRKMTMPAITFSGTKPKVRYPKSSLTIDPEHSAEVVKQGWLNGQPVTVPLVENHPATTAEEVDRLVAELAEPAVAAPVKLTTERGSVTIPPTAIAKGLRFKADKTGKLTPSVDVKKLKAALGSKLDTVEVAPKNATMSISGGKPKVKDGRPGKQVDTSSLGSDLLAVLPSGTDRTVSAELKPVEPKLTAAKLRSLGIKEKVSSFTTNFTGGLSSPRSQNIVTIANDVKGTVVLPGETFSLNGHTGERGYAQGYRDAPVILDGKLVPGVGGGTSQFTTTLFNASYYAGLEDVEHKPHSYYFSRYPAVIESTIFWPNLDFKFRNNTEYGVLIDTSYTGSSVTVSMWSTKIWDSVKTEYGPRRNITSPKTVYLEPGPSCIPANGSQGFTQDAFRVIKKDGKVVKREKFSWTYSAEPRFICAKKPA
ncbi:VanW family protein [Verrucosispora sp. WMMA2121]|uniref:VanW family protein n=1 Tax=Verrucosispora sp. WMMA2121 TaxID=3015164 RepID=UPI0022B70EBA|nr:VanW family protein [Verrucosispora sp. WMMA2121]MCZ7417976.1 VanW family protein [Verrucosispora sp. WMMA2121]MCZ7419563.1 VanW family protein [Verrucosispora sp. WMMA2121]MCZ7419582.1 VanW family protein [Verrucosispora sp. WMMA2121]